MHAAAVTKHSVAHAPAAWHTPRAPCLIHSPPKCVCSKMFPVRAAEGGRGSMKYKGQQVKDVSRWCVASSGVVNSQKMEKEELAAISTNVMLTQLMLR